MMPAHTFLLIERDRQKSIAKSASDTSANAADRDNWRQLECIKSSANLWSHLYSHAHVIYLDTRKHRSTISHIAPRSISLHAKIGPTIPTGSFIFERISPFLPVQPIWRRVGAHELGSCRKQRSLALGTIARRYSRKGWRRNLHGQHSG